MNNNTKTNSNYVRPFAEFQNLNSGDCPVPFDSILEAYYDCRKGKRTSCNSLLFEARAVRSLHKLWEQICDGTYEIGKSLAFIVNKPIKREVFAASFRDRIIHHWIYLRIQPLFEDYLFDTMKSNRKGKGTSSAINHVYSFLQNNPNAWIWKWDIQGFFMSIDKRILNTRLQNFLVDNYHGCDKGTLMWLVEKVAMHCPQDNCFLKCDKSEWNGLPPNKSLFNQDRFHGIAIGNLTSQAFANFYLRDVVAKCIELGLPMTVQYVDDFVSIANNKDDLLKAIPKIRTFMCQELGIKMHPKKCYIQQARKGVSFIGAIIKPNRIYAGKRMRREGGKKMFGYIKHNVPIVDVAASINSYFGYTRGLLAYKWRKVWAMRLLGKYKGEIYFNNNCNTMKLIKHK